MFFYKSKINNLSSGLKQSVTSTQRYSKCDNRKISNENHHHRCCHIGIAKAKTLVPCLVIEIEKTDSLEILPTTIPNEPWELILNEPLQKQASVSNILMHNALSKHKPDRTIIF